MDIHLPTAFFGGAPGGFEILLVLVVILLLFGAKNLPQIARTLGKTLEQFQKASREVREEILRAGTEEELVRDEKPKIAGSVSREEFLANEAPAEVPDGADMKTAEEVKKPDPEQDGKA